MAMKWTTNKPTEPGWYWWYGGEDTDVCACELTDDDIKTGDSWLCGQWIGHIEPPPIPEES
jgi:hypothetical protein